MTHARTVRHDARAADQPFDAFPHDNVCAPLGMDETAFSVPAADLERFAPAYWSDPASGSFTVYDEAAGGQWSKPPAFSRAPSLSS